MAPVVEGRRWLRWVGRICAWRGGGSDVRVHARVVEAVRAAARVDARLQPAYNKEQK